MNIQTFLSKNKILFGNFYHSWLEHALQEFQTETTGIHIFTDSIYEDFLRILCGKLNGIALRTLIEEMHICKDAIRLSGSSASEEYEYYNTVLLADPDYKKNLLEKYPVLHTCLDNASHHVTKHISDMVQRLKQDQVKIEEIILHKKFSKITGIHSNLSDSHNKGKSVVRIQLDYQSSLIYKPHSVENEKTFHGLAGSICKELALKYEIPGIICRDGYGWETCVEQKSCENVEEVQRFYKQIGVCLFVSYLLKTADLHQENLIACGEHPVFIDMEALFTVRQANTDHGIREEVGSFLKDSVLSTGILPFYHWNGKNKGVNLSALSEGKEQELPIRVPTPVELYTSNMHIDYVYGKTKLANNAINLQYMQVKAEDYANEVVEGFQNAYLFVLGNIDFVKKWTAELTGRYSRYLIADTQKYSMILSASYHPERMTADIKRKGIFARLWPTLSQESHQMQTIHRLEMQDLLDGDIPVFHVRFDRSSLYFHGKEVVPDYLQESPQEHFLRTIKHLSQNDLQKQIMLIRTSMSIPDRKMSQMADLAEHVRSYRIDEFNSILKTAIQKILDSSIQSKNEKEFGWISPLVVGYENVRFQPRQMGMYLYDGIAGMLLLFSEVVYKHQMKEYEPIYHSLQTQLFSYTERLRQQISPGETKNTGILNGESSVVAAYILEYDRTKADYYLNMAEIHAEIVKKLLPEDAANDLLGGKAGAILAFCTLYQRTQNVKYLEWAVEAEQLLTTAAVITAEEMTWAYPGKSHPLLGMAHGNAGISLAYGKLYEITGETCYLKRLEKVIRYEHRRYSEKLGDWYDYRSENYLEGSGAEPAAWCHGAGGILSARLELLHLHLSQELRWMVEVDIQRAVCKMKKSFARENLCLCHGISGNLMIMKKYLRDFDDTQIKQQCESGYNYVIDCLKADRFSLIREKYGMGIGTGYGGVLLSVLTWMEK